jgi:2'-5' RNA ligase
MIKKYLQFIKEETGHKDKYGCVMLALDCPEWKEVQSEINPDDIYHHPTDNSYGLEDDPHLTLKFGLHKEVEDSQVEEIVNKLKGQNLSLDILGIDSFQNKDFDVVKFAVNPNEKLKEINQCLSKLPNSDKFIDYNPHITLCYVKPGFGKKYTNPDKRLNYKIKGVCYSKASGEKINYPI